MKFYYRLVVLFVLEMSFTNISAQSYDFEFSAIEIFKLDTSFARMIKYHINSMRKRGVKNSKNKMIFITIEPALKITDGLPKSFLDSVYAINDFTLKSGDFYKEQKYFYPKSYIADIQTDYISSFIFFPMNKYKSVFYCKYQDWNIVIVSELLLKMMNEGERKNIKILSNIKVDKNNMVWKLTNNHTFISFSKDFEFSFGEFIVTPILNKNIEQSNSSFCHKKVRKIKVLYKAQQ